MNLGNTGSDQQKQTNLTSSNVQKLPQKQKGVSQGGNIGSQTSRNMKAQSSNSPTAFTRKGQYQQTQFQQQIQSMQQQQINLPAVNQSRSERSLENSSGIIGGMAQTQRMYMGSQTSRGDNHSTSQAQLLQSQQLALSQIQNENQNINIKQSQNEKIKAYSRKLAKLVSSGGVGGSGSTSRTPNSKKKLKHSMIGLGTTIATSLGSTQPVHKSLRSGIATSRGNSTQNLNLQTTTQIYSNPNQGLATTRIPSNSRGAQNQTFDLEEHIKNVIRSVERRKNKISQNSIIQSSMQGPGYAQGSMTGNANIQNNQSQITMGAKTARNQVMTSLNEYSPRAAVSKSPHNKNVVASQQELYSQMNPQKNTIFSNFSNQTYYMGAKKNIQSSHSLEKRGVQQQIVANSIIIPSKNMASSGGSLSRRRNSIKKDSTIIGKQGNLSRQMDNETYLATQRYGRTQEEMISKKSKDPSASQASIQSNAAYIQAKRNTSRGQKTYAQNQSLQLNQSSGIKKQSWFSPISQNQQITQHNMSNAFAQQHVLSVLDNNTSNTIDKTIRTSQLMSPKSQFNKSGGGPQQLISAIMSAQQQRMSLEGAHEQNPFMVTSFDSDDVDYHKLHQIANLKMVRNFAKRKVFQKWKDQSKQEQYVRKRLMLYDNLLANKSQSFGENHRTIHMTLNQIKYLSLCEENIDLGSEQQKSKRKVKVQLFNDSIASIKNSVEKFQGYIVKSNNEYERRMKESRSVGRKESSQIDMKQIQRQEKETFKIIQQRVANFDRFMNLVLFALSSSLAQMLINNKNYTESKIKIWIKFGNYQQSTSDLQSQYATSQDYNLKVCPNSKMIQDRIKEAIQESEALIFNNRKLIECVSKIIQLQINGKQTSWDINTFYKRIEGMVNSSSQNIAKDQVIDMLNQDFEEVDMMLRGFEDLKQILEFESRWETMNQSSEQSNVDMNRETWSQMDKFQQLINGIPLEPVKFQCLQVDFKPVYDKICKVPKRIISQVERKVAAALESDTHALKQDLTKAYEILQQTCSTLNIYVEQVNTLKVIKDTMKELNLKHNSIKKLSQLCKSDSRIQINAFIYDTIKEVENYIENLPILIRQAQDKIEESKPLMESQMKQSCSSMTQKIKAFEQKYLQHYVDDDSKLSDTATTLNEIRYRQKMIDDIRTKVDLYQECVNIMNLGDTLKSQNITCFDDFKSLDLLHTYTFKLWTILDEWRNQRTELVQRPFLQLQLHEISDFVEETTSFFEQKTSEDPLFKNKLLGLSTKIVSEIQELQLVIYLLKDLKKDYLKKRHWQVIFIEMGIKNFDEQFNIQDLQRSNIYSHNEKIRDVVKQAEQEYQYEGQILQIQDSLNTLQFKLIVYKDDYYVLSEFDIVQSQLEEYQIQLKKLQKFTLNDLDIVDKVSENLKQITSILNLMEKWNDAQKTILALDAIYSQDYVQQSLANEYKSFCGIKKLFKDNITSKAYASPFIKKFFQNKLSVSDVLDKIISKSTLIQKSLEDFLEAKRLAFPRFFFMTDKQFVEFLQLSEKNYDFNKFINLLFPGAVKVFLDQPLQIENESMKNQKIPPPIVNDLSTVKSEYIDLPDFNSKDMRNRIGITLANQKESQLGKQMKAIELNDSNAIDSSMSDQFNSNKDQKNKLQNKILQRKPKEVLGLISQFSELFLFEKKVPYASNKTECWLQATETNMQETIGKLINYAVNTFPKQSLDEWILDYPQQVILTTIHLILTHEINELFEEMRKDQDGERGRESDQSENERDSEENYTGMTNPKTPDTRDLIKNSQISHHRTISQQISQKSSIRFMKQKEEEKEIRMGQNNIAPQRVSTQGFNSRGEGAHQASSGYSSSQRFNIKNQQQIRTQYFSDQQDGGYINASDLGYPQVDDEDFSETELEALDLSRERKKFASNMFGSDFDLNLVADNKDDTMKILQEKSFRGLYLRLQFWINQICKSLHMSKESSQHWKQAFEKDLNNIGAPEAPPLSFELSPVQRLVMQTIINFLSYMRDVVYELKSKKIDNLDDFEWQKQMRLTWNGRDTGCKVDCGAWTTQQANEYLGASYRIPITPLTNKYFVFISAAFREKSAVLFRCVPSHDYCGDVFQEFSNICSVPFKQYQCNPKMSMKSLMQFLNGAALASVWIFFEHVDKLDYIHLQTFNKEIQMVQQQFIIAELSQDSSVITAHITVGNQSISQAQRSIERIREQASLEQLRIGEDNERTHKPILANLGGHDIKIEDNIEDNFGLSPNGLDDDDDSYDKSLSPERLNRQSRKQDLQYLKGGKKQKQQNQSQIELEDEMSHDLELEEENDLKEDDNDPNEKSFKDGQKSQNKVCFGVFASLSHTFNLQREKWAMEVSTALQSAFRVLSLTKPEMPVITSMLLKSEGFKEYKDLSNKINDCLTMLQNILNLSDTDDSYTITVRDLKRLTKAANAGLEVELIKASIQKSKLQNQGNLQTMIYSMERKSKQVILREIDEEETRDSEARSQRQQIEVIVICKVLQLFLFEKLQPLISNQRIQEDKITKELKGIIVNVFGQETSMNAAALNLMSNQSNKNTISASQLKKLADSKGFTISKNDMTKFQQLCQDIAEAKPVALTGVANSGKSSMIKLASQAISQKQIVHFNPSSIGNFRELYGVYDPFSTSSQIIEAQLGPIKYSILNALKQEIEQKNRLLVIDGHYDQIFNEMLLPYLETQKNDTLKEKQIGINLPNGIVDYLKKDISIVYEFRDLSNTSPRFVSSLNIINMNSEISIKDSSKLLQASISKILVNKFNLGLSAIQKSISFSVDQIIIPSITELKRTKYLEKNSIGDCLAITWCLNSLKAMLNELRQINNVEETLTQISIMTLVYAIGSSLNGEGKIALEEILGSLKTKLSLKDSLFNYYYDFTKQEITELRSFGRDTNLITNPELLRASYYSRMLLKNNCNVMLCGQSGTQKSTIMRLIQKTYSGDFASKVIQVPFNCFLTYKSMVNLLINKQSQQQQQDKPLLLMIDDGHMFENTFRFKIFDALSCIIKNRSQVFTNNSNKLLPLSNQLAILCSSNVLKNDSAFSHNRIFLDNTSGEYQEFFKSLINQSLQTQPSITQKLANVIFGQFKYLRDNSENITTILNTRLSNLHMFTNFIERINISQTRDQCVVETMFVEFQRCITDKIVYPDQKQQIYDNLLKLTKKELPSQMQSVTNLQLDDMVLYHQDNKLISTVVELKQEFGDYPNTILKQISSFVQSIKKPNTHYIYLHSVGNQISQAITELSHKFQYQIVVPQIQKYRDSISFIQFINTSITQAIKQQRKIVVMLNDSYQQDLTYIDYLVNLIDAVKEYSTQNTLSKFSALDQIINMGFKNSLVETMKELQSQQMSHSPHSGIGSPHSHSSMTSTISDTQYLSSALTRISCNVHFVLSISNIDTYKNYTSQFHNIESLFQVAVIPSERDNEISAFTDIQKWVHEFSLNQTYDEQYIIHLKNLEHAFNNQANEIQITQQQDADIFKVNSNLNISIPKEYTSSQERFEQFKQLNQVLKSMIYKSLANQKQFYEKYFSQYKELHQIYMNKILNDVPQVTRHHINALSLLNLQEKIELLKRNIKQKESQLSQLEKDKLDVMVAYNKLKEDVDKFKNENEMKIQETIAKILNVQLGEYKQTLQLLSSGNLNQYESDIIQAYYSILQSKKTMNLALQSPSEMSNILNAICETEIKEQVISKYIKPLQKKQAQQDKPLFTYLLRFLVEVTKKQGITKSIGIQMSKLNQLKSQLSVSQSLIQLYSKQVSDGKDEVEDLQIKEKNLSIELKDVIKKIDMKDIKQMRNDYKLKSLLKHAKKSEHKLDKIKIRMKNLEGDCLILACSVVYLGAFSLNEKNEFRKQMSEKLLQTRNIEVSEYWQNTQSEQTHLKYFKKIIQNDLGLKSKLFNKLNHLFVDSHFSEFLFTFIFAPTTPLIYDAVGNYQHYLTEEILEEFKGYKVKVIFSSDYMIQEKINHLTHIDQNKNSLLFINDSNNYGKQIYGKSQDQPSLHRLALEGEMSKVQKIFEENMQLEVPQVSLFSASQNFNMNNDYLAKGTIYNATFVNKNEAWIEIKQILLKHFLPDNYSKLIMIKVQTQVLKEKVLEGQRAFDLEFLQISSQAVQEKDHKQLKDIRNQYVNLKQQEDDYQQYNQAFHNLINEHPLLASYSNIFVILFYALKELTKFTGEITYSWKIYTKVIDMIIAKIIRDLTMNLKNKETEEDSEEEQKDGDSGDRRKKKKKDKEFTIDEEFFHSVIMPSIYSTIVAGIKQEHVSLFNLLFAFEIALKKTTVTIEDKNLFISKFFVIKNCYDWRLNPHKPSLIPTGFAEPHQKIKLSDYMNIKRDVLKLYPEMRKLFETIEIKIGKEFTYKDASNLLYHKLFKQNSDGQQWKDIPLIKKLIIGFICPDDEWRSKVCQFVYEELTTIFDYNEDLNKLHNFIKTASWSLPIALFTSNSINIVNTVCSIASYYGVGLEVLRTDYQQSIKKHEHYYKNKDITDNIVQNVIINDPEKPLSTEAACTHFEQLDSSKENQINTQRQNIQKMFLKDELEIDDKQITQNQSSIQLIEKCAENGTWVLISTLKFPSFWYKISKKLERLHKKGKVVNTFRLFFDLQGYSLQEIPESFLFNHSVKFYLTEKNNEDMEGFNDVWANILNDDLLNAKDLQNVPVLEAPSDLHRVNLNMESNLYESIIDNLVPQLDGRNARDQINPIGTERKLVKDDKITYSMSQQSKDTMVLPQIFTKEHMKDLISGGNDLMSPKNRQISKQQQRKDKNKQAQIEDEVSDIHIQFNEESYRKDFMSGSNFLSNGTQDQLLEDMSKGEEVFLSELNQAFAKKPEIQAEQQPKYEMVKKPAPNHKRQQPPHKQ